MLNYAVDCYDYVEDIYLNFISEKLWSNIMLLSVITFVVTFTKFNDNKDISRHNYAALLLAILINIIKFMACFLNVLSSFSIRSRFEMEKDRRSFDQIN